MKCDHPSEGCGADLRGMSAVSNNDLFVTFGIEGTGSVSNPVRRAEQRRKKSKTWPNRQHKIEESLGLNTQHKA